MGRRPARIPEVLHNRNFALYYTGQSLSVLGDAIVPVALAFAVLDLGRGAGALGLVLAAASRRACCWCWSEAWSRTGSNGAG
ncbi:hypothetical protein ACFQ1I_08635 [Kitasatospora arboriphila]